jgi:hypothetical protein
MNALPNRTSSLAIVSLVSGIVSWVALPFIGAIVAIITGHMARGEIRSAGGAIQGDGLAIGGLILGYLQVALTIVGIAVIFLFLGGMAFLATVGN